MPPTPRRGDVWLVALNPTVGHEIQKTRPAIVVTDDLYNKHNWVVLVVPVTSRESADIDQVLLHSPEGGLSNTSVTLPDQMRAIDRQRLVKHLGRLSENKLRQLDRTLRIVLSLR